MRIGIIGGSFDPIHFGHLLLAERARDEFALDKVLFMPAKLPPHKLNQSLSDVLDRLEMVSLAIEENEFFELSDLELKRQGPSYTIDSIISLQQTYPKSSLYFIAGADSIFQIETWMTFEELLKRVTFIGVIRPGYDRNELADKALELNQNYSADVRIIDFPYINISSTEVRRLCSDQKSLRYLLPEKVRRYIHLKGLYEEKRYSKDCREDSQ